jgi:hypothetical protein
MKHGFIRSLVAGALLASAASFASADVLTFDDIDSYGTLPANYGGLDWSSSNWIAFGDTQDPYAAHSGDWRVATDFGSSDADSTIHFLAPTVFDGAWFSGYGEAAVTFELYLSGALVASSVALSPTSVARYLASGYAGLVDTVVVSSPLQAFYAMDDFTFHSPVAAVPEPQTWALLLAGLGVVTMLRRKRCD